MGEPSASLRVRVSADLAEIRQGFVSLTREVRAIRAEAGRPLPTKNAITELGVSAGQTAQAMRQLPAQFTDIFTSLQGGMPFFTVLVQQGGQIKDSFGGVEPALKGVSSALLGMVSPYTAAAAAVGVLVYAWYDAQKQQEAYTRALVLSRNEAAASTLTLVTLAQRTSEAMQVTAGAGEEAALAIGSNGRIAAQNMQAVASAAVAMKEITGQSVEETVAAFGKLAEDPIKNAQKLNDQVNFMTVDLYEHVKALQEQGRNQDAVTVITRAAADETVMALAKVRASQNPVIRGFRELWAEATKAWQAMQASAGFAPQELEMQNLLKDNWRDVARLKAIAAAEGPVIRNSQVIAALQRDVSARSEKIKELAASQAKERKDAEVKAAQTAAAESVTQFDAIIESQASKEQKKKEEIARINGQAEIVRRRAEAAGLTAEVAKIEERRAAAVQAIEEKYKKKGAAGTGGATRAAGLQSYKDDLLQEQATIEASTQTLRAQFAARQISAEAYYSRMRELTQAGTDADARSLEGQIEFLKKQSVVGKDGITVNRQLGDLEARLAKVRIEGAAKLQVLSTEEEQAVKTRRNAIEAYTAALEASNDAFRRQMEARVAQVGMGDREYEIQQQINGAYEDRSQKLRQLTDQLNAGQIDQATFDEEKAIQFAKLLDRLGDIRNGYQRLQEAEGNWLLGAAGAWENYRQQTANAAQQMGDAVSGVFTGLEDVWVKFTQTGKLSFSDMTRTVLADLSRIILRKAVAGMSSGFGGGGAYTGTLSSLFSGSWGFSSGGYTGDGGVLEPAGVVHKGEVVWSQADIARAGGLGVVEAMRRGLRGFADGGVVGQSAPPMAGGGSINVRVINAPPGTSATATPKGQGGFDIDVLLGQVDSFIGGQVASGQGSTYSAVKNRFGVKDSV
ncbi:phage tail tape measure protein [Stenotrophomonas maltophilia]|uniref:phage tail tape measure protein n=1 Tax=Stenotrophomonas maltophilia TaxID=40324 RepID=UPI0021C7B1EA|nr:phage tail tape measure protein [Stenotrophomonas maltophilia]MCU1021487.1 phage tail tape measure protein [Stenotrophomonas maltophilia]